ncbi:MAG TPA: PfkB family carbohydrate kinase [Candidatus Polarisedimenticolaceae bacterium]|nr:PfkB family carbohydrate kinase [Candidatus Polarisedimenticolaceae bacterium]
MSAAPAARARLVALVDAFAGRRVAVLGDLLVDEFLHGDIARVSREAPVLILEHRRTVAVPGGGANSVVNLRALGARPLPVGVIGRDAAGRRLVRVFRELGIDTRSLVEVDGYETPSKCRVLAGGTHTRRQQIVRVDYGAGRGEFPRRTQAMLRRALRHTLLRADGLLIADYGFGSAAPEVAEVVIPPVRRRGLPVTVDSRSRVARFSGVSACTPNQEELELAFGRAPLDGGDLSRAARQLLRRTGNDAVLVTRGAEGMALFPRGGRRVDIPAFGTDEVADVTGAGDTVIATFTLALLAGGNAEEAARIANYAAGIVVTKAGTATTSPRELIAAIGEDLG